jgi:hypothetical protein
MTEILIDLLVAAVLIAIFGGLAWLLHGGRADPWG